MGRTPLSCRPSRTCSCSRRSALICRIPLTPASAASPVSVEECLDSPRQQADKPDEERNEEGRPAEPEHRLACRDGCAEPFPKFLRRATFAGHVGTLSRGLPGLSLSDRADVRTLVLRRTSPGMIVCNALAKEAQSRASLTSREQLMARDRAFTEAHQALLDQLRSTTEETARAALLDLLATHQQRLSPTEVELWTLEIVDPEWAKRDPQRAARLMAQLQREPSDPRAGD